MILGALTVACAGGVPGSDLTITFGPPAETSADADSAMEGVVDATTGLDSATDVDVSTGGTEESSSSGKETTSDTVGSTTSGPASCGNDVLEGAEVCDGTDLNGKDCTTQGFDEGTLACAADCADFDTSGCVTYVCGDGVIEGSEVCDGANLDGESCTSQGFDLGTLGCTGDCEGYDLSGCASITCGNGVVEMGEACDGAALSGQTCISQGFDAGMLACTAGCAAFNTSGCIIDCVEQDLGSSTGLGVAAGSTVGEDDTLAPTCVGGGADHVMSFTATGAGNYVFDTFGSGYDTALAVFSDCGAGSQLACNDDSVGLQSEVTVALAAGQTVNVVVDGFGAATGNWVLNIEPPGGPALPACAEQDLGSSVGSPVAMGTTVGQDEDLPQSCGAGGVDYVLRFIAPATATFQFDTFGSGYDTVLSLHNTCAGPELGCNDDTVGLQSQVNLAMVVGQEVLVAVSGYSGATGNWVLDIVQL